MKMIYTHKQLCTIKTLDELLNICFDNKNLKDFFPNLNNVKPGEWCENDVTIDVYLPNKSDVDKVNICLYREPLTKDGKSRNDSDPFLENDYAGRFTVQAFWSDGQVFDAICFDAGLPTKYTKNNL